MGGLQPLVVVAIAASFVAACTGSTGKSASKGPASSTTEQPTLTIRASTTIAAPTSSVRASSTCATAHLRLTSAGTGAAAGTSYTTYDFTNAGATECVMIGYPGVAVLDAHGHVVQHPAVRQPGPGTSSPVPVALVRLPPGQRAKFVLASENVVPNPDCQSAYGGATLSVYPPDQTVPILQPFTETFCDLMVGPVQAEA